MRLLAEKPWLRLAMCFPGKSKVCKSTKPPNKVKQYVFTCPSIDSTDLHKPFSLDPGAKAWQILPMLIAITSRFIYAKVLVLFENANYYTNPEHKLGTPKQESIWF